MLDSCHALMNFGADHYKRRNTPLENEQFVQSDRERILQNHIDELWQRLSASKDVDEESDEIRMPPEPQENILYFL